ncbi:hypothetical protein DFJ58DRAFT_668560, partial [Suillus subalutaceus]|uniref:uncharacterized protein n=1 Tax=Suillus subalutaceus TaxID=48586 RepID=UPI001B85C2B1
MTSLDEATSNAPDAEDIISKVELEFGLNDKQRVLFCIVCNWFIKKHILKIDCQPLSMIMTGLGGTGKTCVVNAVKAFMAHYGCAHLIHFLAPTGSATSLIDGMTTHKGLGIKIKASQNGKSNWQVGDKWQNIQVIFVDEASML